MPRDYLLNGDDPINASIRDSRFLLDGAYQRPRVPNEQLATDSYLEKTECLFMVVRGCLVSVVFVDGGGSSGRSSFRKTCSVNGGEVKAISKLFNWIRWKICEVTKIRASDLSSILFILWKFLSFQYLLHREIAKDCLNIM